MDIFSVLHLILGLVFFLFGMNVMSSNLEKMAGGKLESALKKATANPFVSMALGAGITIAIQSSSATTVMLVGLVNSGIMKFAQTLFVTFGANIGTTLTAWILSLSGIESNVLWVEMLKPENFSPIFAIVGIALMMMSKSDRKKSIGTIFVGFAVLMYGMELMKNAVSPLSEMPEFSQLLVKFNNPIIGVVIGTLFTAVIQSSAASVGILQALSLAGGLTYGMAIPIIMGQNIGTCITAIISCIGTNANAKRVAVLHLSINTIGTVIVLSVYSALNAIFSFGFSTMDIDPVGIALMHTVFNVIITAILAPFAKQIIRLAEILVPDDKKQKQAENDFALDNRLLSSPSVAVRECGNYTKKMARLAESTMSLAVDLLSKYDRETVETVKQNEKSIDKLEDGLGSYLVRLSASELSMGDSRNVSKMLHTIGDFERLGDHALNLTKAAEEIHDKHTKFSPEAQKELAVLTAAIRDILSITVKAFCESSAELAARVEPLEQVVDKLTAKIKNNHIARLQNGECTIETGFVLSDIINNFERISDHCSNVAVAVIELDHGSFDTHKYLYDVKHGDTLFGQMFNEYKEKYTL